MNTMNEDKRYNGWTNYETWLANLWMDNDEDGEYWREEAPQYVQRAIDDNESDIKMSASCALADAMQEQCEERAAELNGVTGLFADLMNAALKEINWHEIARHYIDEIDLYSAGTNTPGYMPDSDPAVFVDFDDAKQYIIDEIKRDEDDAEDESLAEELASAAEDVNLEKKDFSITVGNRAYWVSKL
jgi:hypothetical protein